MKRLLIVLSLAISLAACGGDEKTTNEGQEQTLQERFTPMIKGSWVMLYYLTDLDSTKSPKISSRKLEGIVSMDIDPTPYAGDTVIISGSLNNHERFTFYMFYRPGQEENALATAYTNGKDNGEFYELEYTIHNHDTLVALIHYDKDKEYIDSRFFVRASGPQSDNGQPYGLSYMANKVLFSGNYTVTDENGKTTDATFTDDGLVTGIGNHTTYFVFTDFTGEDETNLDEMLFDEHTKTQKGYIFEIKENTTYLYQALENEDRTQLIRGDLKYTMIKKQAK